MFALAKFFSAVESIALNVVRRWWRPVICLGLGLSLIVNGVVIPLVANHPADLTGLAAMVGALSPFAWLRTQEKLKGCDKS